jgi:hypothetical protein
VVWEIWNEPNIFFWKPKPVIEQYIALAVATGRAVKEADPAATLIGPATSEIPWEFLEKFLKSEAPAYLDGISVHPYRGKPPESAAADYLQLRELIAKMVPMEAKKALPIISGEWGYSSHLKGVSLEQQAAFLVRQQLVNLHAGVPISIWYDWKNDGDDPKENEHNFGTVLPDLKPKPAYQAVQALTHEFNGYRVERRLITANTNDFVLLLKNGAGQRKLAAWTLADTHPSSVLLGFPADRADGVDFQGARIPVSLDKGLLEIPLTFRPSYIRLR